MKKVCALVLAVVLIWAAALPAGAVDLQLAAPSAVLMDLTTGTVLYEVNAHQPMAPASVTKVMTLLLIMEAIDSGKIGWQDMVTASEAAAAKGGSQVYLKVGETMSVEEMVKSIAVCLFLSILHYITKFIFRYKTVITSFKYFIFK